MKRVLLLLALSMLFFIPTNAGQSDYTCDTCHQHADLYKSHVEGGKYCSQCHGDVHETHKLSCETCHEENPFTILCHSAPSDVKIPTVPAGKHAVCENCHMNIVSVHGGNCQTCHTEDVNEIHKEANVFGGE